MGLDAGSTLLDIACGDGKTATYLAKSLGFNVSGIDVNEEMIDSAMQRAKEMRVEDKTDFSVSIASEIPYDANSFAGAISECSLCTFSDKEQATKEISRVLNPGGVFGLNDVTVRNHGELDEELTSLLGRVACVADALSSEKYVELFNRNDFELVTSSNHSDLLADMTRKAMGRARFFKDVGGDEETVNTMSDAMWIIDLIEKQIESRNIGYVVFIFQSE